MFNLLFWALPTQNFTCLSVWHVVNEPDNWYFLPFLEVLINLATYDMIQTVCQNPCFSKTWCRVSFISVAPGNPSLTSLVFASVSLLGLVCITAGHFSGLDSQFGAFSQISRRSLDRVPVLCSCRPPLNVGRGINLSNSIGHKLFVAPFLSDPIHDYCTVCPSIHRTQTSLHILPKCVLHGLQGWLPCE